MLTLLLASLTFYVNSPVVDMREHPKKASEIVSQVCFSEQVTVLEESEDWVKIETAVDHYQGWIQKGCLFEKKSPPVTSPQSVVRVNRAAAHVYSVQDTVYGPLLTLPFDSKLELVETQKDSTSRWIKVALTDGREAFIQRGDVTFNAAPISREEMCALSLEFLGLPYTWGGRSSFGYDCSGFVQTLYRQMGIYLPRDSKDQIKWDGFSAISLDKMVPGDLLFFGLSEDKIRHVGIYLGKDTFIHSTVAENAPYIRISRLTDPEWNGSGRLSYRAARTLK